MIVHSPESSEFTPDVVRSAVFDGAAKISGLLSYKSVGELSRLDDLSPLQVVESAPELEIVFNSLLTAENFRLGMTCQSGLIEVKAEKTTGVPHKDSKKLRLGWYGLSLLLPLNGGEAFFAADEKYFELFNDEYKTPDKFWTYGPGDAIFIRQRLNEVDGTWYPNPELGQIWHVGWGKENRQILGIDFRSRGIVLPGSNIEKTTSAFKLAVRSVFG